jgi:uracil-DNA glycosylase family 4
MTCAEHFNPRCRRCERLTGFLAQIRRDHPDYHAAPVPPFGVRKPDLIIVGLAPGMHGANATGRPFTGDYAGILLYETLYRYGFSNRAKATYSGDGLRLRRCRITNAVKCLPPANKPTGVEVRNCNSYLRSELAGLRRGGVILSLGRIAHEAVLQALDLKRRAYPFGHGRCFHLEGHSHMLASYHCSRYNTQTRRLTPAMFDEIFDKIHELLDLPD